MRWGAISEAWDWVPPPGKKNKRSASSAVAEAGAARLDRVEAERRQARDLVFSTINWRFQSRVKRLSGIEDFFPHAIRHTVETKLAELERAAARA